MLYAGNMEECNLLIMRNETFLGSVAALQRCSGKGTPPVFAKQLPKFQPQARKIELLIKNVYHHVVVVTALFIHFQLSYAVDKFK